MTLCSANSSAKRPASA